MIWNIVLINLIFILGLDCTDFPQHIKSWLQKWITKGKFSSGDYDLKPFLCSTCMTFWTCLIYIILSVGLNLQMIFFSLALAVFSPVTASIINFIKNGILKLIGIVAEWLGI